MIKNIISGVMAYFGTFKLISKLGLWKYFFVPIIISLLTGLSIGAFAYSFSDNLGQFIARVWIWKWGSETFTTISTFLGGFSILIIGLVLYKHIVMAFSAPFMSPVSEKIEFHIYNRAKHTHRNTSFSQQLIRGIRVNVRNLIRELLFVIPLIILSFIPVVGILATIFIFVIQSYYVGFGNMDYTMERHLGYKESIRFVRNHRGIAIGNGIVFMLMTFIPILGFIITLPISVVAASTETIKVLNSKNFIEINPLSEVLDKKG